MAATTEKQRDRRNLDPHKGAVAAMWLWGEAYAAQRGGSMDFWDSLTEDQRRQCIRLVQDIECARPVPLSA